MRPALTAFRPESGAASIQPEERFMATIAGNTFSFKPCFSTSVCPEWTAAAIVDGLGTYGFEGVEICIGQGHLHGVDVDTPKEALQEVRKQFDEANLAVACLATPINF